MLLSELIRSARAKHGWTLRELEQRTGIANSIIAHVESGKTPDPRFSTVAKICKALKIRLDAIDPSEQAKDSAGA